MSYRSRPDSGEYLGYYDPAFYGMKAIERWLHFRQRIWERDKGICGICGQPVELSPQMHIDHIKQRVRGGPNHWDNFRIAHAKCNQKRKREWNAQWTRLDGRIIGGSPEDKALRHLEDQHATSKTTN